MVLLTTPSPSVPTLAVLLVLSSVELNIRESVGEARTFQFKKPMRSTVTSHVPELFLRLVVEMVKVQELDVPTSLCLPISISTMVMVLSQFHRHQELPQPRFQYQFQPPPEAQSSTQVLEHMEASAVTRRQLLAVPLQMVSPCQRVREMSRPVSQAALHKSSCMPVWSTVKSVGAETPLVLARSLLLQRIVRFSVAITRTNTVVATRD